MPPSPSLTVMGVRAMEDGGSFHGHCPLQLVEEIEQESDVNVCRSSTGGVRDGEHHEPLAIGCQVEVRIGCGHHDWHVAPRSWLSRTEGVSGNRVVGHKNMAVYRLVIDLPGGPRPSGIRAWCGGDLPFAPVWVCRIRPHINVRSALVGGDIGDPA